MHGVDGAFLQRFSGQTDLERGNGNIRQQRDEVGEHVQAAAEQEGRVYAIMYVFHFVNFTAARIYCTGTT